MPDPDPPLRSSDHAIPAIGTLERWAWDYLSSADLSAKFDLRPPPRDLEEAPPARPTVRAARPRELTRADSGRKTPGREALRVPARRAQLVHTFLHHELQAAELMCWAILAFPRAPTSFRRGLAKIARDEVRHMQMYREHLASLGHAFGDFAVRDWFWKRVPSSPTPAHFVATMGMGFEGANLDHTLRFEERFRAVGDVRGGEIERTIFEEEIPHVRFAVRWFRSFTGESDFASWVRYLPPPLSPMVMRGDPIEREGRLRSGFSTQFVDELSEWRCRESGY